MFGRRNDRDAVETQDRWGSPPVVRGVITLLGVAVAGFLVWLATLLDLGNTGEFWAAMGLLAAAGLVVALSQLFGGWTKWGLPTISPSVFLLAFLPTLIVVGGILLATRNTGQGTQDEVSGWIQDIGLGGLASDLALFQGVLAFGLGLVFGFIFDTRPATRIVERDRAIVPDEDVHDYERRETTTAREEEMVPAGERRVDIHDPDRRDTV